MDYFFYLAEALGFFIDEERKSATTTGEELISRSERLY